MNVLNEAILEVRQRFVKRTLAAVVLAVGWSLLLLIDWRIALALFILVVGAVLVGRKS